MWGGGVPMRKRRFAFSKLGFVPSLLPVTVAREARSERRGNDKERRATVGLDARSEVQGHGQGAQGDSGARGQE